MNAEERCQLTSSHGHVESADPRSQSASRASSSIARAALAHLPDDDVVFVDSGAMAVHVAQSFAEAVTSGGTGNAAALSFVTHSIPVALELSSTAGTNVQLLGGSVNHLAQSTAGDTTLRTLALMRAKVAVIDADALTVNHGLSTDDAQQAAVKSAMVTNAEKVVVLCNSARFGQEAVVSYAPLDSIDVLITDADASDEVVQKLSEHGIDVVRTDPDH